MTGENPSEDVILTNDLLEQLTSAKLTEALALLSDRGMVNAATASALASTALIEADAAPESARKWIAVARGINTGGTASLTASALIDYADARLHAQAGSFALAEQHIRQAQAAWCTLGDEAAIIRSNLGLTQILTVLGRYSEAEQAIQAVINGFQALVNTGNVDAIIPLLGARRNLANIHRYQEQHPEALSELEQARSEIEQWREQSDHAEALLTAVEIEAAHHNLAYAISATALDRIAEAEDALIQAIDLFVEQGDLLNQGRGKGNLGELYLRTGLYGKALQAFDEVASALTADVATIDPLIDDANRAGQIAELYLNRSFAYLALNLLPEAEADLQRCIQIFDGNDKSASLDQTAESDASATAAVEAPYELALALSALGQLYFDLGENGKADDALDRAERYFDQLNNRYWQTRIHIIRANAAARAGDWSSLSERMGTIQIDASAHLDLPSAAARWLLAIRLHIEEAALHKAQQAATDLQQLLQSATPESATPESGAAEGTMPIAEPWAQIKVRLYHAEGQIAQAYGDYKAARTHFERAINLMEAQRSVLAVEEIRSAYLIDKTQIYADLLHSYLEEPTDQSEQINQALDIVERMRSRTLLERLIATVDEPDRIEPSADSASPEQRRQDEAKVSKRDKLRQELNWLYNQLLGNSGTRRSVLALTHEIDQKEQALQAIEWRTSPVLGHVDPVTLPQLQETLESDQQVLLYHIVNDEVMAFVISSTSAEIVRHVCAVKDVAAGCRSLRFQLGRVEVGGSYGTRHVDRLQSGIQDALEVLYALLINPLEAKLTQPRLQIIPTGVLSLIPFHALWRGDSYLLENFECTYAPSASIAVICKERHQGSLPYRTFAGIGLTDNTIPFAKAEIAACARYFEQSWSYLDANAGQAQLAEAASKADILHIATHGLYRFDNPFFSSLKLADGWADVREIYRLPLKARLVVLSACESGVGHIQNGDENIGLARGFLGAGAHSLLVSLWNVHDATAGKLMERLYGSLTQSDNSRPSAALRSAQLALLEEQKHPYFWASFISIG